MLDQLDALDTGALFSPCRRWRYLLWRRWDPTCEVCAFIGLNPSTADETQDDPTVRRCIQFAKTWGFGSMWMLNAYAWRATKPEDMKAQGANAIGPLNNEYIAQAARHAFMVIAAWGTNCDEVRERDIGQSFENMGKTLCCLGHTQGGHPKHPLYLRSDTEPMVWEGHGLAGR